MDFSPKSAITTTLADRVDYGMLMKVYAQNREGSSALAVERGASAKTLVGGRHSECLLPILLGVKCGSIGLHHESRSFG